MTLIDLYVAEVGKRLPRRGRSDIEAELRSTLEDMLEDRSRKAGRPADEALMLALLRDYGPPDKVAASYDPHPYLIGPRLFPFFIRVIKIVLSVLTTVLLVTLGIQLATQPLTGPELARFLGERLLGILSGAVQAFGSTALVFAILERVVPASEFKLDEEQQAWDPTALQKAAAPETLKPWEPIAAIVEAAAALIVFNGYPGLISVHFKTEAVWRSIPLLTEAFFRWLPYINVLWALQIALNVVLLRRGRQQALTHWFSVALDAAGVVLGYLLLAGPPIAGLSPEALVSSGVLDARTATLANLSVQQGVRIAIAIAIIAKSVGVVKQVIRPILARR